jgi:hypothetical protein
MARLSKVLLLLIFSVGAIGQLSSQESLSSADNQHTEWVARALKATQSIRVGMTRSDLLRVFTTEGGISMPSQQTYVYRKCPYIKVDVKFAASSNIGELPQDKITEISRPYLAWTVTD